MRAPRPSCWLLVAAGLVLGCDPAPVTSPPPVPAVAELIGRVRFQSREDALRQRVELRRYIWGGQGELPARLPDRVERDQSNPLEALPALARLDALRVEMDHGVPGLAHHFIPRRPNGHLVIFENGHFCDLDNSSAEVIGLRGVHAMLDRLLREGYGVLGVYMPYRQPDDCRETQHGRLFSRPVQGSPLRYFLDPTVISLNYLRSRAAAEDDPAYTHFSLVGHSGGGWTATLYAALDPTIGLSVPIAGTLPRALRKGKSRGDAEQRLRRFYNQVEYQELYFLGALGEGRRQVQVLSRHDSCCFGERPDLFNPLGGASWETLVRAYEADLKDALHRLGNGSFELRIDEEARYHSISRGVLEKVLLPELARAGRGRAGALSASEGRI